MTCFSRTYECGLILFYGNGRECGAYTFESSYLPGYNLFQAVHRFGFNFSDHIIDSVYPMAVFYVRNLPNLTEHSILRTKFNVQQNIT